MVSSELDATYPKWHETHPCRIGRLLSATLPVPDSYQEILSDTLIGFVD